MRFSLTKKFQEAVQMPSVSEDKCADCAACTDNECVADKCVKLSSYGPGQKGTVFQVCGNPEFRRRLMEMGFVRGAEVTVVKYAPLSDPIEFLIKGYHVSLRRDQAADILMNAPGNAA